MTNSSDTCDVAVVGAGPAGLAAAVAAADGGATVALVDAEPRPGGQFYRHPPESLHAARPEVFHHEWSTFVRLCARLAEHRESGRIDHLAGHQVWSVEKGERLTVHTVVGEGGSVQREVRSRALVLATGAYDRQIPFPGWQLPGVMTAGGVQALLKGNLVMAGNRIVVAGTGPLLLSVACALLRAGSRVVGVFEAGRPARFARHSSVLLRNPGRVREAAGYLATLARHRVPFHARHAVVAAHGGDAVESVTIARVDANWRPEPGSERRVECDVLAVGYGFVPQIELPLALGCATRRDVDGNLVVTVDDDQQTSVELVFAAGEVTGVGGAALAVAEGTAAGTAAARRVGCQPSAPDTGRVAGRITRRRHTLQQFAAAVHDTYQVQKGWLTWLSADTMICRCEEVTAQAVQQAVELGATDARSLKLLSRAGMGYCQARMCGYGVTCIGAWSCGRDVADEDILALSTRPLAQPVSLRFLAESGDR